jgi:hypothetical protein
MFRFIVLLIVVVSFLHLFLLYTNYNSTNNVAVHMTQLVSHYGFREETHDISGVKIHCVVKDPSPPPPGHHRYI